MTLVIILWNGCLTVWNGNDKEEMQLDVSKGMEISVHVLRYKHSKNIYPVIHFVLNLSAPVYSAQSMIWLIQYNEKNFRVVSFISSSFRIFCRKISFSLSLNGFKLKHHLCFQNNSEEHCQLSVFSLQVSQ